MEIIKTINMAGNITFTIIKPFAVRHGYIGPILAKINEAGFRISAMKFIHLRLDEAKAFYAVHDGRPFFEALVSFMSSGPIVVAVLEKENAVEDYRKLIGSTNPSEAAEGTIRRLFGTNIQANAVHGSDCDENAEVECNFFFAKKERF
jgi:nucleoside-diphosphate kinase